MVHELPPEKDGNGKGEFMLKWVHLHVVIGLCLGLFLVPVAARAAQNIEGTPQAKVYRAALKAVAAGDYQAYR
ncbi:MAG TPA: hypothetical protein VKU62_03815, partial [Thermoanaerobaculia bacterium]|nr:hypothetical protein [Thermoanaerobaculia bacterium]